jgi:hypothetical protein
VKGDSLFGIMKTRVHQQSQYSARIKRPRLRRVLLDGLIHSLPTYPLAQEAEDLHHRCRRQTASRYRA